MNPLVSVIIPAYNASAFIGDTLRAVLNQSLANFEILILNDGSTDDTEAKIQAFRNDARVIYHSFQNSGVSSTRNKGIRLARGKYIAFLDADDTWTKDNLEKKVCLLENNNSYNWVFSDMFLTDSNLVPNGQVSRGKDEPATEDILLWEGEVIPGPCSNILVEKALIETNRILFDDKLSTAADQDFSLQLTSKGKGKRIPEDLVGYRVSSGSMSRNVGLMERDHLAVYRKATERKMFRNPLFRLKCYSNLYLILAGSWWHEGRNKTRAMRFIFLSVICNPVQLFKLIKKLFR